ncbi:MULTISPECIES: EAL domain-containing protein [Bradyrhizobium]|uniref:EAL domain-containing protein n=1 Tax=Bradyrhizobium TaxID=374 RepID=UPI00155F4D54|nr:MULTISPECIES: EAL domain-containing protein [Bradyrhizobium]MDD1521789.1 bifunctional diguanylate cyclase/phosphodiesterase [Bradyrhizobium sp. WBAH30]MDD1544635.1 bifunctional diguanylate cyclase/phosphodiesterase [Bradyrhizobium sp. WBAH41]MDD1559398.1 bifunctional diguanylate cyclase/phosphodiesterase [Bradyrhizobium sp. WBAH23]MDD1566913.1 bifunctional diguanylate cyclase/phosphodiesterase [Bradyrhizobium sp. WBAH33]MDD1592931.1 bifunctional diguanylate cyclase/phosphodiesterase [Bradyr
MFRVFSCLTTEHDWRLVVLAALVCFVASIVAVSIFHRAIATRARTRWIWIAIAGAAIGYGIWATHFVAMLAYEPGVTTGYGIVLTASSLAAAMLLTSVGFGVAVVTSGRWRAAAGGIIIGGGIASMHYIGMWALEVPGRVSWSVDLVLLSIVLGMCLGYAALAVALTRQGYRGTLAAAVLLTLAIVSHHFTAMGAVQITPDPARATDTLSLSPAFLALAIAGVALSVLGMSLIGVLADRRLATRTARFEEIISQLSIARQQLEGSQNDLKEQKLRLDTAINHMVEGLCMFDAEKRLVICNERYARLYRLPSELLRAGTPHRDIIRHRVTSGILEGEASDFAAERQIAKLDALPIHAVSSRIDAFADGRLICVTRQPMAGGGWVATHLDVTEQRRSEAKITYMAQHDALTELPNRVLLKARLEPALADTRGGNLHLAVLLLDLDRFKEVNDTLGHPAGDLLLRSVATRLLDCVRETTFVARLGGDEFAIVDYVTNPAADAASLAEAIHAALSAPFDLGDHQVIVGTSIGIALAPQDGADSDTILRSADLALYSAKSAGRGAFRFFEPELDQLLRARRNLERDLRKALARSEFELHYQPFVNLNSGETCGFEALLRWHHPERGLVSPGEFIPVAEETGLILPLGEWVLRTACAEAAKWRSDLKIAVNLSPAQFRSRELVSTIVGALAASGIASDRLELEVTETVIMHDSGTVFAALSQLRELGVRIALDDFGTGYSSLSFLQKFPFDKIKIDRSFVSELSSPMEEPHRIARAVVQFATSLGKTSTAEGVETAEQLDILRQEGCIEAQGFYLSPPMRASTIARLVDRKAEAGEFAA